jgi:ribosome maturation factor RimP
VGRKEEIIERVRSVAEPLVAGEGMELVEVELVGSLARPTLRLYIDKADGGISLDDCALVSRSVSAALDVEDPIEGSYELEVSSPGLDRPLRKAEHFTKYAGEMVRIKTYGPVAEAGNRKNYLGVLKGFENGKVLIDVEGTVFQVPLDQIAKAHIEPEIDL